MRLDKFLKVSRIIKRRTVAVEACDGGRVSVNGKTAKPGLQLKVGDKITISFGNKQLTVIVKELAEFIKAPLAETMYEVISD